VSMFTSCILSISNLIISSLSSLLGGLEFEATLLFQFAEISFDSFKSRMIVHKKKKLSSRNPEQELESEMVRKFNCRFRPF
jgi:hypothetical protein